MGAESERAKELRRIDAVGGDAIRFGEGIRGARVQLQDNQIIFRFLLEKRQADVLQQETLRRRNPSDPGITLLEARINLINELVREEIDVKEDRLADLLDDLPVEEAGPSVTQPSGSTTCPFTVTNRWLATSIALIA